MPATIALQINTSYQATPLTSGALSAVAATNKVAITTPPSVNVPERLDPPVHTGVPVGSPGATVKGAALNYSGNADVTPAVKFS
ncbi:MAG TPA: hypothetical protein VGG22_12425 [Candidatus Baltobacteraceae bacterium]|jgi:hypothetical protein